MGRTSSLRDYMADIALSNVRSGGGSSGGGELPGNYLYNKNNVETIILYGSSGKNQIVLQECEITEDTTYIDVTIPNLFAAGILYKNGIFLLAQTEVRFNSKLVDNEFKYDRIVLLTSVPSQIRCAIGNNSDTEGKTSWVIRLEDIPVS